MATTETEILARWQTKLDGVDCSPLEFFALVELSVLQKELPSVSFSQIVRQEGGWFSPHRVYFRIRHKRLFFDVSAFVIGCSLCVGWWLHEDATGVADLFAEIPVVGFLFDKTTRAATYYAVDFIEHFQRAIHEAILQVVDRLSKEAGMENLPTAARQPVWEEIW